MCRHCLHRGHPLVWQPPKDSTETVQAAGQHSDSLCPGMWNAPGERAGAQRADPAKGTSGKGTRAAALAAINAPPAPIDELDMQMEADFVLCKSAKIKTRASALAATDVPRTLIDELDAQVEAGFVLYKSAKMKLLAAQRGAEIPSPPSSPPSSARAQRPCFADCMPPDNVSYTWGITSRLWNALMHALHGNGFDDLDSQRDYLEHATGLALDELGGAYPSGPATPLSSATPPALIDKLDMQMEAVFALYKSAKMKTRGSCGDRRTARLDRRSRRASGG